jgi:hypothetical protein
MKKVSSHMQVMDVMRGVPGGKATRAGNVRPMSPVLPVPCWPASARPQARTEPSFMSAAMKKLALW